MRILFTTHQGGIAGSTFSIYYLASGLARKGHQVHVACPDGTTLAELAKTDLAIQFHDVRIRYYLDFSAIRKLGRIIGIQKIQVVNAQSGKDRLAIILTKWINLLNFRLVITRRQRPRSEPFLKRWFLNQTTDRIIVISEGLKEMFIEKGYPSDSLKVINNGIPADYASQKDEELVEALRNQLNLTGRVIGCVARRKRQEQLIAALRFLPEDLTVLFVGIEKSQVKHILEIENPLQRLVFTGRIPHEEVINYYPLMDVSVLPSVIEGFGLVLIESMQMGVPVIGTNRGGIKSIIEPEQSGLLFEDGDIRGLSDAILKVLGEEDFRKNLIRNGYRRASQFTLDKTIEEYDHFFHSLLFNLQD